MVIPPFHLLNLIENTIMEKTLDEPSTYSTSFLILF